MYCLSAEQGARAGAMIRTYWLGYKIIAGDQQMTTMDCSISLLTTGVAPNICLGHAPARPCDYHRRCTKALIKP